MILYLTKPKLENVAPYTGAWIEIKVTKQENRNTVVAPYTGAWIEIIFTQTALQFEGRRTLHGCVD